jgi:hypothetical protein
MLSTNKLEGTMAANADHRNPFLCWHVSTWEAERCCLLAVRVRRQAVTNALAILTNDALHADLWRAGQWLDALDDVIQGSGPGVVMAPFQGKRFGRNVLWRFDAELAERLVAERVVQRAGYHALNFGT